MLAGLYSLQFPGSYLSSPTDSWFYMRTKLYTNFDFRVHSGFSSPAASRISLSKIPRSYSLPNVQVMSSELNILPGFTKHLVEFCWTRDNSWNVSEIWYKSVAEFMSFQAPTVFPSY
ncbi:unnamed protein product [Sphagnum troendelagicum]|uniref:Uncharacterized protein n=1 Tax=Sphagnum troendelagicum TaxID=128251 RepID=A0ABP0UAC9_9BRYO